MEVNLKSMEVDEACEIQLPFLIFQESSEPPLSDLLAGMGR
jgi:hypothetical protein